jgi:hypothetical protein
VFFDSRRQWVRCPACVTAAYPASSIPKDMPNEKFLFIKEKHIGKTISGKITATKISNLN